MKISAVCLGLNLVFALWLILPLRQGGLGIANTLTAAWNVGLLLYALRRKLARLDLAESGCKIAHGLSRLSTGDESSTGTAGPVRNF